MYESSYFKPCHGDLVLAFEYKGIRFYASSWRDSKEEIMEAGYAGCLLIDLDDNVKSGLKLFGIKAHAARKLSMYKDPAVIKIHWPDFGVPPYGRHFFERLLAAIREENRDVVVFCQGGHGRTGTCLSILAAICGLTSDPIKLVREIVCKECVESESQIKYIKKITGLETKQHKTPTKVWTGTTYYSGNGVLYTGSQYKEKDDKKDKEVDTTGGKQGNISDVLKNGGNGSVEIFNKGFIEKDKDGNPSLAGVTGYVKKEGEKYYWADDMGVLFMLHDEEVAELKEYGIIKD